MNSVLVLHNVPREESAWHESEFGVLAEVGAAVEGLTALGIPHRVAGVRRLSDIPATLGFGREECVFNLVQSLEGDIHDFNLVPAVCRSHGRRCTGSSSENLLLTFNKARTKAVLADSGIITPAGLTVEPGAAIPACDALPPPPWIVKPDQADGSEGIEVDSIAQDTSSLDRLVKRVHGRFSQQALVEHFIDGREFNVSLLAMDGDVEAMPVSEIDFGLMPPGRPRIVDYAVKWVKGTIPGVVSPRRVPAPIPSELSGRIRDIARRTWLATGCRGYARVDFRMNVSGDVFVIEVNANPDISSQAAFPAAVAAAGIPWKHAVARILADATTP